MKTTDQRRRVAQLCGVVCVVIATATNAHPLFSDKSVEMENIKIFVLGYERDQYTKLEADGSAVGRTALERTNLEPTPRGMFQMSNWYVAYDSLGGLVRDQ